MLVFLKKKFEEVQKFETQHAVEKAALGNIPEFIPYDCHFNPHTILTKNGELLQTIKIASNTLGLDYEGGQANDSKIEINVRNIVRRALVQTIGDEKFSFWIHTMRKRKDVSYSTPLSGGFDAYVHEKWQQKNSWKYQFYNEVYVTVLHDGQDSKMIDKQNLAQVVLPLRNRNFRNGYLEKAATELDTIIQHMMEEIRPYYNVQRLAITERIPDEDDLDITQPIFYSEPMEFLGNVLNMRPVRYALPEEDLSTALATHGITFGFNALESRNADMKRRFGAVLTLKQYRELTPDTVDRILQAPMEFVITQNFSFIPAEQALEPYREQKDVFEMSGDEDCLMASGIREMMRANKGRSTDFCEYQTSISVMVDDYKQLNEEVAKIQAIFSEVGLITIREDIRLEECFWSQLPGNFEFIRRKEVIDSKRAGGFCRLNRFPNGTENGNHWGPAVTLLPTFVKSPYFFNFHVQDNGHTVIFDYNSFNDAIATSQLNFLLCETRKYDGRMYVFDRSNSAELFFDRMGADYHTFPETRPSYMEGQAIEGLNLNPFTLEDSPKNRSFLLAWCTSLISPDTPLSEEKKDYLSRAIEQTYGDPESERSVVRMVDYLAEYDVYMAKEYVDLEHDGMFNGLIGANENLDMSHPVHGFEMNNVLERKEWVVPLFSYLMHRIISTLDGRPTIIVMHEAWDLLENSFFAPRLESLLDMLQQNNVMVIFTTRKTTQVTELTTFNTIMQKCPTRIYIPDDVNHRYASDKLDLTEGDHNLLRKMDRQNGHFLLKQQNESIALTIDFRDLEDIYSIMGNDAKSLSAAGGKYVRKDTEQNEPPDT